MSKVFIEEETLIGIGNAIRKKSGTTDLIATTDMANAISNLPSGGGGELRFTAVNMKSDDYRKTLTFDLSQYVKDNNTVLIMCPYGSDYMYSTFIKNGVLDTVKYQMSDGNVFGSQTTNSNIVFKSY